MATNPLYQSNDSPNNSTQPTKAVNRQGVSVKHTHNTFDNSYYNYMTTPFGVYFPFFSMEGVPGDIIPLHSEHTVRSLPMSSPFLSNLSLNKDTFMVPMQAILPNTWELIYKTPAQGDDVPDEANCLFPAWEVDTDADIVSQFWNVLKSSDYDLDKRLWSLLLMELFCSQGCLLSQMGYHVNPIFTHVDDNTILSFDELFDTVIRNISYLTVSYKSVVYSTDESSGFNKVSLYQILNMIRTYGSEVQILLMILLLIFHYLILM